MTDSSTTPPYSNASSSSTPTSPQNYFQPQSGPSNDGVSNNGVDWNQWAILIVSMLLTGVIGYFSSLMAVKDDIAKNREGISVSDEKINNVSSGIEELKSAVKSFEEIHRSVGILEVKVQSIQKEVDKHSVQIDKNNQVITSKGSGR